MTHGRGGFANAALLDALRDPRHDRRAADDGAARAHAGGDFAHVFLGRGPMLEDVQTKGNIESAIEREVRIFEIGFLHFGVTGLLDTMMF